MRSLSRKNKIGGGFTLVELVVSIGIFGIILVLMSNIVIAMSMFALDNERRSDFITELDNAANIIKNDLRSAQSISTCSDGKIFRESLISGATEYYKLVVENNTLIWEQKDSSCNSLATPKKMFLTSPETVKIDGTNPNSLAITSANDSRNVGQVSNTLLYIRLTACTPDAIPDKGKIFHCTLNPYKYTFAISTRNIF